MKEEDIRKRDVFNKYLELSAKDINSYFNDKSNFSQINCPACESDKITETIKKNGFTYYECSKCETLFVNPRPGLNQLNDFYANSPSTSFWVNEFFKPVAEARREKMFRPRAEYISEFLSHEQNLTIGDIGAGFGLFLEELRKIRPDFELFAIEPSSEMANICRGKKMNVIESVLEKTPDTFVGYFDVLTSFELFEHLYDPKDFLEKIFRYLKPGGYFIFTTLNGLGFDIQLLWEASKSVSPPHHLNFFNPKSVEIIAKKVGFETEEIKTPGKLDWNIIEGGMKHEAIKPGRFWETLSKHGSQQAKDEFQVWIEKHNLSSHMRAILRKPVK